MSDYVSVALGPAHDVGAFRCGKQPLDEWLQGQAHRAQAAGTARTYVWAQAGSGEVLAYFSVAPTQVVRSEVSRSLAAGYSVVPGYLLARLALDQRLHRRGLGSELLVDALERIVDAAGVGGGRLIVVDAIDDEAHAFYRRHDFVPVTASMRLYLKVATARAALGVRAQHELP
ncbi:MAG: GNAT family N-acetyltransferase [Nocardioides sp.]